MNTLIQFLYSRPTEDGRHRMRYADLFHTYRELIQMEDLPNVKNNVYDEERYLVATLTHSLLAAASVIQGDKQEFLIRRYLQTVVEELRRPAYPEKYPSESLMDTLMGLFGHPSLFDVRGPKFIKEHPMTLNPFPRYEDVQHYVGRIFAGERHDSSLNSFTLGFYSFLLTIQEEPNPSELTYRYLSAIIQLESLPAGTDRYDNPEPEKTTYLLRF